MRHNGTPPRKPFVEGLLDAGRAHRDGRGHGLGRSPAPAPAPVDRQVVPMSDDDWKLFKDLIRHYKVSGDTLIRYLLRREGERVGILEASAPPPPDDKETP